MFYLSSRSQAHKRKIEAAREEKRRQEILSKRREEQNQATEKFQRSHIPAASRQNSGRSSPKRHSSLEDALRLIRTSPRHGRPPSGRHHTIADPVPGNENADPLDKSYYHSNRPSSGRSTNQINSDSRAEMMDHSMKNLTSSRSLFEQQLEQQQNLLLEQQQQALVDFNNAVYREINRDHSSQGNENYEKVSDAVEQEENIMQLSDSCDSLDSLDDHRQKNPPQTLQTLVANGITKPLHSIGSKKTTEPAQQTGHFYLFTQQDHSKNKNLEDSNNQGQKFHQPLNLDMTPSATFHKDSDQNFNSDFKIDNFSPHPGSKGQEVHIRSNEDQGFSSGLYETKQPSLDSLAESASSNSSISVIKVPGMTPPNVSTFDIKTHKDSVAWVTPSPQLDSNTSTPINTPTLKNTPTPTNTPTPSETYPPHSTPNALNAHTNSNTQSIIQATQNNDTISDFNPRYASAIGASIWPGQTKNSSEQPSNQGSQLVNNTHPYSNRGTLTSVTATTSFPASSPSSALHQTNTYTTAGGYGTLSGSSKVQVVNFFNPSTQDNHIPVMSAQDLSYPLPRDSPAQSNFTTTLHQGSHQSSASGLADMTKLAMPSVQSYQQVSGVVQQRVAPVSHVVTIPQSDVAEAPGVPTYQTSQVSSGPIPVPAIRTFYPQSNACSTTSQINTPETITSVANLQKNGHCSADQKIAVDDEGGGDVEKEDIEVENDNESMEVDSGPPLKGILKPPPPRINQISRMHQTKQQLRDSLELTRLNANKKVKKSLRNIIYN